MVTKKTIINYYDYTVPFYKFFWHGETEAVHYGIWDETTNSLNDALLNTNRIVANLLDVKSKDKILDAGCGVGGSSVWIAKNTGAKVIGITISEKQLIKAKQLAVKKGVGNLTEFLLMNYSATQFKGNSIDGIFAIESVCHANPKSDFLKETYRILKPGGKMVVVDGFINRDPNNTQERKWLEDFYEGMALESLDKVPDFIFAAKKVGFKNVKFIDKTKEIMPSSKTIHDMCLWGYPIATVLERLHITPHLMTTNCQAGLSQYESMLAGMGKYGIIYAEKVT